MIFMAFSLGLPSVISLKKVVTEGKRRWFNTEERDCQDRRNPLKVGIRKQKMTEEVQLEE
jgi:hypothetical protein